MKQTTEQIGKTIEEAIRKGLEELKVSREDVIVDVLEQPKSGGILGVLSQKLAKVRLTVDKKISKDVLEATRVKIDEIFKEILNITKDEFTYTVKGDEKQVLVKIECEKPKHIIGYKGKTVEAIQSILNAMLQHEDEDYSKVFVEVNEYKKVKEAKLRAYANKMANNVVKFRKPIRLEPMTAYERLIIHQELAGRKDVVTESYGKEPSRKIMIKKNYIKTYNKL